MKKQFKTWRHRRRMKWCIRQAGIITNERDEMIELAKELYGILYVAANNPQRPIRTIPQTDREVFAGKCHQAAHQMTALLEKKSDFGVDVRLYQDVKNNSLKCLVTECREL